MGNKASVFAQSKPIQDISPVSQVAANLSNEIPENGKKRDPLDNPGTMEEIHKKCKGRSPKLFKFYMN